MTKVNAYINKPIDEVIKLKEVNQVKVFINGEMYELISEQDPAYIQTIASYIDEKIKDIYRKKNNAYINSKLKALFISINIADDLFKEREKVIKLEKEVQELSETLAEYMTQNKELVAQIETLKHQKDKRRSK